MTQKHTDLIGMGNREYYANKLLNNIYVSNQALTNPIDIPVIQKAISYLQVHYHTSQHDTKEQSYIHPLAVALMIMEYYPTTEALATALLYNLVRQDVLPNDKIIREFGIEIANKIEELANLHGPKHAISATQIKRMIEKGDRDILIIKLLNDLYIMQNISIKPKWEQLEAALQVLKTSLPLAMYINLPEIESGLEAICRSIIIPELARDESTSLSPDFNFELLKFQL